MIRSFENRREKRARPFCQATGCFDHADYYVVIKETEESDYYEVSKEHDYEKTEKAFDESHDFDGFKLILYLCRRHENDFKYLIRGSELRVAKKCALGVLELRQDR
jgi:hypothetical protein